MVFRILLPLQLGAVAQRTKGFEPLKHLERHLFLYRWKAAEEF
jgi:hypothetical protein